MKVLKGSTLLSYFVFCTQTRERDTKRGREKIFIHLVASIIIKFWFLEFYSSFFGGRNIRPKRPVFALPRQLKFKSYACKLLLRYYSLCSQRNCKRKRKTTYNSKKIRTNSILSKKKKKLFS